MKINKDLFELLSSKSSEILQKFETFIQTLSPLEVREHNNDEGKVKRYIFLNSPSKYNKELNNHISAYFIVGGAVNAISFGVSGDVNIVKKVEKKNFWGKTIIDMETTLDNYSIQCYPLVSKLEDTSWGFLKLNKEIFIDFEEYLEELKKINFANNFDTKILDVFNDFLSDLIAEYQLHLNENSALITKEIRSIDKNEDGLADIIDPADFMKLTSKHQPQILEVDKELLHKFIKVSNYLKKRAQNIQTIYSSLLVSETVSNKFETLGILKNQIHSYELLVFHSLNMVGAIIDGNLLAYYEIYETFDKLNVFNSNSENEIAEKLSTIGNKLDDLMQSIYNMEQNIVNELSHLSYITQESFDNLNKSVTNLLSDIESSINMNNLLTGIQAYQLYKINKNTKPLIS